MKNKLKAKLQTPPLIKGNSRINRNNDRSHFNTKLLKTSFKLGIIGCFLHSLLACSVFPVQNRLETMSSVAGAETPKLKNKSLSYEASTITTIEHTYTKAGYLFGAVPPLFLELPICDFKHVNITGSILHPKKPQDLWQRIRQDMALNVDIDNALVEKHRTWFINHPEHLLKVQERASKYLYFIVEELEARNLPLDLALLPAIESAYNPFAYSSARASGLWQFIPDTGRRYGLKQDGWFDGRRDVIASTHAALDYLADLNEEFDGDWLLSLAAYNTGTFNIEKAILRNKKQKKSGDYWSLALSEETKNYVPRLVALAQILSNPEKYGVDWETIPNKPEFTVVTVPAQVDLLKAAKIAQIEPIEFFQLNAGYKRWISGPFGPHRIVIPVESSEKFQLAWASLQENDRQKLSSANWQRYLVKVGDNLDRIARLFNTSVQDIKNINQLYSNNIKAGDTLLIPKKAQRLSYN